MEIIEIISHYVDKQQNIINVEFRIFGDDDDVIREDIIEYTYFEEFGFDDKKDLHIFEEIMDEDDDGDEWDDDDFDYIQNEDTLTAFLNEYYVVYPKKLPKSEYR
jgi:hypothetical protein|tara:strand:- start:1271 stop:1585 length:315 start_codon:yes stop_codon:yes gene_type:complete